MHSPHALVAPNAAVSSTGPSPLAPSSSAASPQIFIPKSSLALANPHQRAHPDLYRHHYDYDYDYDRDRDHDQNDRPQTNHQYRRAPTLNAPPSAPTHPHPHPHQHQHQPQHQHQDHIASAIAASAAAFTQQASKPAFSARTSSLLPPPHLTAQRSGHASPTAHIPPTLQSSHSNAYHPPSSLPPLSETDPSAPPRRPSRSSSLGGVASDSVRNLNRWSASTTSSHASNSAHPRTQPAGGRRMSVDAVALQARSNPPPPPSYIPPNFNSPRKLQKSRRPSTASGDSPRAAHSQPRPQQQSLGSIPPLESLPPIIALPSLEQEVRAGTPSLADRSLATRPHLLRQPSADASEASGYTTTISRTSDSAPIEEPVSPRSRMQMRTASGAVMTVDRNGDDRSHSRHRSQGGKGSTDSSKARERSKPSQKAMLSRALEKANTAVQLDNAGNVEGARAAYAEACDLLQQVLLRTSGDEDKRKLEEIRKTYTTRIDELDSLDAPRNRDSRPLPIRPESLVTGSNDARADSQEWPGGFEFTTNIDHEEIEFKSAAPSYSIQTSNETRRRQDSAVSAKNGLDVPRTGSATPQFGEQYSLQSAFSRARAKDVARLDVEYPMDNQYMPPPLSPRRPSPPPRRPSRASPDPYRGDLSNPATRRPSVSDSVRNHARSTSQESISWLDPIDESGSSVVSSVHSRSSSMVIRRKHIRAPSGDTEAEFDAALDDAIEAAYDDGYEPMDHNEGNAYNEDDEDVIAKALKRVQLAREKVKESEQEALALANERERRLREQLEEEDSDQGGNFFDGEDSEEEERILEEITRGHAIEEFAFGLGKKKPSLQRESDSSEHTNRTWHSSNGSNPPAPATTLSTVSEHSLLKEAARTPAPSMPPPPPPSQALPKLPPQARDKNAPSVPDSQTVRNRRLSGQNPKQLKIETSKIAPPPPATVGAPFSAAPAKSAGFIAQQRQALSAGPTRGPPSFSRHAPSPAPGISPADMAPPPTPPLPQGGEFDSRSGSPSVSRQDLRKNFSSSSLKNMKHHNMSQSMFDDVSDMSPGTPHSNQFGSATRLPAIPNLPTPVATAFQAKMNVSGGTGGFYLFESDFHSPTTPGSPNTLFTDAPVPLESCPTDTMLRPFWLMRCLYQTLAHPRGGYISNKLFVPRDVWSVKGVKLKNVEDKIANCDLLSAALLNLAKVDTNDADAVLEEMQNFENILEQVQMALTRKLGHEVGVVHSSAMFRDASSSLDPETGTTAPSASTTARSGSVSGKSSSSFSWRRLRSKNSNTALSSGYNGGPGGPLGRKDSIPEDPSGFGSVVIPSLPMTSHPTSRPSKRDVANVQFTGPNANYMASLARLFDAAQAIDQIARQVEDPGLRHADKTQVGLELCTRHAAEFFGFYICRFVLADLTMLLDKFMKRGSEWVLV